MTLISIFALIFGILPSATLASIPIIGDTVATSLNTAVMYWNSFMITFPYAETIWHVVIFVILPFETVMLLTKIFLGSRTPTTN